MILMFFNMVGPILQVLAEKRTEILNVYGLKILQLTRCMARYSVLFPVPTLLDWFLKKILSY